MLHAYDIVSLASRETSSLRCGVQKVQDIMLAEVQGRCREVQGGAGAVQGGARAVQGGAGRCRGGCTICTSASIISGAGRCRRCRHTSEHHKLSSEHPLRTLRLVPQTLPVEATTRSRSSSARFVPRVIILGKSVSSGNQQGAAPTEMIVILTILICPRQGGCQA